MDGQAESELFKKALDLVQDEAIWKHVIEELSANRPPQLPWELLMELADNAIRLGKFSSAGQAYEQLRMRRKMQDMFLQQGLTHVSDNNFPKAVKAFRIGAGLGYDYAAFPEPLPNMPKHAVRPPSIGVLESEKNHQKPDHQLREIDNLTFEIVLLFERRISDDAVSASSNSSSSMFSFSSINPLFSIV